MLSAEDLTGEKRMVFQWLPLRAPEMMVRPLKTDVVTSRECILHIDHGNLYEQVLLHFRMVPNNRECCPPPTPFRGVGLRSDFSQVQGEGAGSEHRLDS